VIFIINTHWGVISSLLSYHIDTVLCGITKPMIISYCDHFKRSAFGIWTLDPQHLLEIDTGHLLVNL